MNKNLFEKHQIQLPYNEDGNKHRKIYKLIELDQIYHIFFRDCEHWTRHIAHSQRIVFLTRELDIMPIPPCDVLNEIKTPLVPELKDSISRRKSTLSSKLTMLKKIAIAPFHTNVFGTIMIIS